MPANAVLFDLDGTLVDTAPDMAAALNRVVREEGFSALPAENIRPHVSRGGLALTRLAFGGRFTDETRIEALRQRFLQYYLEDIAQHSRLFEGFEDLLNRLEQARIAWGIVTNKPAWLTDPLVAQLKLNERSAVTISGDTTAERKPHPLPLITAAETIGLPCDQCIYVGDDPRDIEAGKAARMTTVVARWGYIDEDSDPDQWQADFQVDQPGDLSHLVFA
jgi:phosphoglycolate phosphatase